MATPGLGQGWARATPGLGQGWIEGDPTIGIERRPTPPDRT
ncbi:MULTISPECIES: hypothetical protein [unclassified Streptomyces]|nr:MULTISPECIES: hypothetical protein [unclassified Streptomyces]